MASWERFLPRPCWVLLSRWQPIAEFPVHVTVVPDARVFFIAFLLALASGILPGLLPARQIWQTDAMQAMKSAGPAPVLLHRLTLRDLLLVIQITVCALLVTASLVALRGLVTFASRALRLRATRAMVAGADMRMAGYSDKNALPVQRRMIDEASRISGVTAAGTMDDSPLSGDGSSTPVYSEDATDLRPSKAAMEPKYFSISPGYLQAAGTHLLAGRDFTWNDGPGSSPKL